MLTTFFQAKNFCDAKLIFPQVLICEQLRLYTIKEHPVLYPCVIISFSPTCKEPGKYFQHLSIWTLKIPKYKTMFPALYTPD